VKHEPKIEREYLDNLVSGIKKSLILINDRDYQNGDILVFKDYRNFPPEVKVYEFTITHIHSGLGMEKGYVVLSVKLTKGM